MNIANLLSSFADPPLSAAPMLRWWWFGPSVQRDELDRELTEMARAGFGGVEVAYVYPVATATTEFLSEPFLADLRFAAERARDLGLRFDLTLGSGWSFGGPHITGDLAARRLHWDQREIHPGALNVPVTTPWPGDELVGAYLGPGSHQEAPDAYEALPIADGMIKIPDGRGPRIVLMAWSQRTGQNVKRAAVGSEGPVLDHYSAAAVDAHLRRVGDRLLDAVPFGLVGSVFCDSLEVYGADWTPELPQEFARRRGYPLLPQLHLLGVPGPDATRIRADYHRTLAELYQENFVARCQRWAAGRGVPFRIQSYGAPPATLSSYRFADLFEGEGWGWKELTPSRWASSAAHLYGRDVASAEVWTWVHSPSFRATPLDLKGEAHEHLLNGVNQLIGHGWPYSPTEAPGLGWFFYAAGAINDRNPWWPAMPALNAYLRRLCWVLRQGDPVADVAVYVPNEDLFATMGRAVGGSLDTWREANRQIPGEIPATIRAAGLDYDLIDDDGVDVTPPDRYRVVVVPVTTALPDGTTAWLERVSASGGSVITVDSAVELPGSVPATPGALAAALSRTGEPDLELTPATPDIGFVHRRCADTDLYVVVNTGAQRRDVRITGRGGGPGYQEWDPASGLVRRSGAIGEGSGVGIELSLDPYAATVIVLHDGPIDRAASERPITSDEDRRALVGGWQVRFPDEPARPVDLPHVWEDEPGRRHYSGAATYTTRVELAEVDPGAEVQIDLGESLPSSAAAAGAAGLVGPSYRAWVTPPVGEIAAVRVNEVDCGLAWAPPYRLDITAAIRAGQNTIEITVYNTAANALAAEEHIERLAAQSEAQYGRRFRMQELDLAMATVGSGLLQVPALVVRRRPDR